MRGTSLVAALFTVFGCLLFVAACGDSATEPSSLGPTSHTAFPQLANQRGRTLSPMRLLVIAASNDRFRDSLLRFGDAFAFVRRCGSGPDTTIVPLTVTASHEVIEAATDPALDAWILKPPFQPWTASAWWMVDYPAPLAENADLCPATRYASPTAVIPVKGWSTAPDPTAWS